MSAPDDPTAPSTPPGEAIQSAPADNTAPAEEQAAATEPDSAPVPESAPAEPRISLTPERFLQWRRVLDFGLVAIVLLTAFEVGFFPIRNSDLLMHRAVGRSIAQGEFDFHTDPFAYTTPGVRWVDHSWLFGVFAYWMSKAGEGGDATLIALKALLLAALAEIMLRLARKPGRSLWVPALCTGLAVLTLSPRVTLHSGCISYLFLGLTLYLLEMPRRRLSALPEGSALPFWNVRWFIVPLCALWVNCDGWFVLGPITVGLYLIGELLEGKRVPAGSLANLGFVLAASVVACVANPYHVYAFSLPEQLGFSPAGEELRDTAPFSALFFGPLRSINNFFLLGINRSVAGLAYFPLVLLGVVSFGILPDFWRSWRAPVWLFLFLLSGFHGRAIPFFAIAAGPITALNFLDYFAAGSTEAPADLDQRRRLLTVRVFTLLLAFATFTAGSAGWLHVPAWGPDTGTDSRRPGWWTDFDLSLVDTAEAVANWRKENLISADTHWFNTSPDAGNYFAWYAPGVRMFIDGRLSLFSAETARQFREARDALYTIARPMDEENAEVARAEPKLAPVFAENDITFLLIAEGDLARRRALVLQRMLDDREDWTLCHLYGGTAVFGWNHAKGTTARTFDPMRYNASRLAFGPDADKAPRKRPPTIPAPEWWQVIWQPETPRSPEAANATIHNIAFQAAYNQKQEAELRDTDLRLVLTAGGPFGPLANGSVAGWMLTTRLLRFNPGPPAEPYLALRAARRALEIKPEDGQAWLELGRAYSALIFATPEQLIGGSVPMVREVREAQVVAALTRAARWNPNLDTSPHELLASQFQAKFLDLTLLHREAQLRGLNAVMLALAARADSSAGLERGRQETQARIEAVTAEVQHLKGLKKDQEDRFELDTANKPPLVKAQMALRYGLAELALKSAREHLQQMRDGSAEPAAVAPGLLFLVQLLIATGELDEARVLVQEEGGRDLLNRSQDRSLPVPPEYAGDWYSVVIDAASGDYENADETLSNLYKQTSTLPSSDAFAISLGDHLLWQAALAGRVNGVTSRLQMALRAILGPRVPPQTPPLYNQIVQFSFDRMARSADIRTARGWLALEAGDTVTARNELVDVLKRTSGPHVLVRNFRARPLAELALSWLESNSAK